MELRLFGFNYFQIVLLVLLQRNCSPKTSQNLKMVSVSKETFFNVGTNLLSPFPTPVYKCDQHKSYFLKLWGFAIQWLMYSGTLCMLDLWFSWFFFWIENWNPSLCNKAYLIETKLLSIIWKIHITCRNTYKVISNNFTLPPTKKRRKKSLHLVNEIDLTLFCQGST